MRAYPILLAALLCGLALGAPFNDLSQFGYNPVAQSAAVVVSGNARFTVLTDYVIRIEYNEQATFEDRPTIAFVNRNLTVPNFTQSVHNNLLTIQTSKISVQYVTGNPFTSMTLSGTGADGAAWQYGQADNGNLLGTVRSLDELCTVSLNCNQNSGTNVHNESLHCAWGVISRSGWTTIDDTGNFILGSHEGEWFDNNLRNRDNVDIYFFGHASNYRRALRDFTALSGHIPMLPRAMLGSWFTRWFDFDNSDIERVVDIYDSNSIPLTTFVFDMNWHTKNDWTGFSWDRQLFPYPQDMLAWLHHKGLHVAANIHDADGVGFWEDKYKQMCIAMGQDPNQLQAVPFAPLNATYMHTLQDVVLSYTGFDFFWIDWQQGGWAGGCSGGRLNPTIITNHVRGTSNARTGVNMRDGILARFGGLGNHRYPVGFSGDVSDLSWECFAFQPYFSITGANVAYGYISNDLVGPPHDHELHVRWMQFGAFSGVMRIHDRGMSAGGCYKDGTCGIVNIWKLPFKYFEAIREAMTYRVALLPYIYTASWEGFTSGVSIAYPMYYDWPESDNAYLMGPDGVHAQYMFGGQMLVAPICAAASNASGLVTKTVWLPKGRWYDDVFGHIHHVTSDNVQVFQQYSLYDVPIFIKAGAIIPRLPNPEKIGVAADPYTALDIYIYPGELSGTYTLYEDDGLTFDYLQGNYATTVISYNRTQDGIAITVQPSVGQYTGVPNRKWRFFIVATLPLSSCTANGQGLPYSRFGGAGSWYFDGKTATVVIDAGSQSTASTVTLSANFIGTEHEQLSRAKGYASRLRFAKRLLDDVRETPYSENAGPGLFKTAAAHAVELTYLAGANATLFMDKIGTAYLNLVQEALTEIGGTPNPGPTHNVLTQLYDATRHDMLLCGSQDCLNTNWQYTVMWSEGYQPTQGSAEAETLYDYWNPNYQDNYATTSTNPPNGYEAAIFSNGYVYNANASGRACFAVYFSPATNDHMTTASSHGREFAENNGYVRSHDCIGYTRLTPPTNQFKFFNKTAGEYAEYLQMEAEKNLAISLGGQYFSEAQALVASALPSS